VRIEGKMESNDERVESLQTKNTSLEAKIENGFRAVDARFQQLLDMIATSTSTLLEAIKGKRDS
jgi:hypothetical protein